MKKERRSISILNAMTELLFVFVDFAPAQHFEDTFGKRIKAPNNLFQIIKERESESS